jgi:hypothetical protein
MKLTAGALVLLFACTGCDQRVRLSPVEASDTGTFDPALSADVGVKWSPYVGVHITGEATQAYRDALTRLQRAGKVAGVRVEISRSYQNPTDPMIKSIAALGLDVLGLVGNEYLFAQDIEQEMDRIFAAYPEIRYFQIGNEATTILPSTGPTITIDQYMIVFQRIYNHVRARHPGRAVLLTQSTLGVGLYGARELEAMVGLGLERLDPAQVIIAVNAYDPESASQYRGLLGGPLRRFRVWVTESGVADPARHIPFVQEQYPLLRNYLRAERVYWYVMWAGDAGSDSDFSLIKYPASYPDYWRSPLFDLLARRN